MSVVEAGRIRTANVHLGAKSPNRGSDSEISLEASKALRFSHDVGGRHHVGEESRQIAALHSGDWLLKTLLIAVIIGVCRMNEPTKLRVSSLARVREGELTC